MKQVTLYTVPDNNIKNYHYLFDNFGHFENLIRFILNYENHTIKVDDLDNPSYALLLYGPAIIIKGNPNLINVTSILQQCNTNSWVIPSSTEWDKYILDHFEGKIEIHNRVLFDSSTLDINHITGLKKNLPEGMRIEQITSKHIEDTEGILYQDLIRKFYNSHKFQKTGRGFVLMDGDFIVGYAASDNPIIGNNLELMFRVGYDNFTKYRGKGYGIQLCVHFIEYCLTNNLIPSWDAHTDISAHIANKLGYKRKKEWTMFHIL
jgi:hypothetical protein